MVGTYGPCVRMFVSCVIACLTRNLILTVRILTV